MEIKKSSSTDILLFLILVALVLDILVRIPIQKAVAETFKLDSCITASPSDKPEAYLHVVQH